MRKFLVALLSLGLIMAFSMKAVAADVKFSGQYYALGLYEDNHAFANSATKNSMTSIWSRLRVQTVFEVAEGLSFTTRFDAFEKQWGNTQWGNQNATYPDGDKSNSRKASSFTGSPLLQENIEMEYGYVTFMSKIGQWQVGYQAADEWGTVFADIAGTRAAALFATALGPVTLLGKYEKSYKASTSIYISNTNMGSAAGKVDADFDIYTFAGIYKFKAGEGGLLYKYMNNAATTMFPGSPFKMKIHGLAPYVKATFGPLYIEAEGTYAFGKYAEYQSGAPATGDIDKQGYGAYAKAQMNIGAAFFGAQFGYSSGNGTDATKETTGPASTVTWVPALIFGNANLRNVTNYTDPGITNGVTNTRYNTDKTNLQLFSAFGGYKVTPKLTIEGAFVTMQADKAPANYVSKNYGMEADLKATYKIYDNLTYMVGAGYLWTGDFFKGTDSANTVGNDYLLLHQLTLTF